MSQVHHKMLADIPPTKIKETEDKMFISSADLLGLKTLLEASGEVELTAGGITVTDVDNLFASTEKNVENILKELFTYANNGKQLIAAAIVGKGIEATSGDSFSDLATKISTISNEVAKAIQKTKFNVVAPYVKEITLTTPTPIESLTTTVLKYTPNPSTVQYTCNFDNTDSSNFSANDKIMYDGTMRAKTEYVYPVSPGADGITDESDFIYGSEFQQITNMVFADSQVTVTGTPLPQFITANDFVDITGVETFDGINWSATATNSSQVLLLINFGTDWKAYNGIDWVIVDTTNMTDIASKGMPKSLVDTLDSSILEIGRDGSTQLKFGYYIDQKLIDDIAQNDGISFSITMIGSSEIASPTSYTMTYNEGTNTITYTFNEDGTYIINYND